MGWFDFFRKKKNTEEPLEKQQEISMTKSSTSNNINEGVDVKQSVVERHHTENEPVLLSELLMTATPSKQGLYPHEIMMLEYAPRFKTVNNTFQGFWYWQYSITEPQAVLDSLYKRGFIEISDLRTTLERLRIPEIKEELKLIQQKMTGKKAELIDRLIEFGDIEGLEKKYIERYYVITSKGEDELNENQYVSYLHRHRYMTCWEMNKRIAQTHYSYRDVLWGYFNEQSVLYFKSGNFGLYRNVRSDMYRFLMEERKYELAFHMLCEVLAYDLSLLSNSNLLAWENTDPKLYLMVYESEMERFFPYKVDNFIVPPGISDCFAEMQTIFRLDTKNFKEAILKELDQINIPHKLFTNEESVEIIIAEMNNDIKNLKRIFSKVEEREKDRLKEIKSKIR